MGISRREFLENSMFAAAAAAAAQAGLPVSAADAPASGAKVGPNEKLRVATIGVNGQGGAHVGEWLKNPDVDLVAICDLDPAAYAKLKKQFDGKRAKDANFKDPEYVQDIRKLLEKKEIDAVSIATPNHWHALAAIWAIQAGKDVYVEKPVSHNVSEGRRIVQFARKHNKIVQTGTQSRSMSGMRKMLEFIHAGKIGKVTLSRGLCYKPRKSIGKAGKEAPLPAGLDFDIWAGPAPKVVPHRSRLHYDWHWAWATGNGDLGNQGIHEMDKARWGLGKNEMPKSVFSLGGRLGYEDDGETANTQLCFFDYGDAQLIFEVRGLETKPYMGAKVGNIWTGTDGYVVSTSYASGTAFDLKGNKIEEFKGGDYQAHFANFVKAVKSRKPEDLHAEIEQGHLSSALCHLGNISYRLGEMQALNGTPAQLAKSKEAAETYERFSAHLADNGLKLTGTQIRVGKELSLDVKNETFLNDKAADAMLTREYRAPFVVPDKA